MYVDTPYTRFKSLMPKTSFPWAFKTRNMYRICCKKYIYSLFSATNFRNLQQSDWLQDRFDSWLIERATSLLNSVCSNVAKQVARFCCRLTEYLCLHATKLVFFSVLTLIKTICAKILAKNHCRRMRNVHFRLACVAQREEGVKVNFVMFVWIIYLST